MSRLNPEQIGAYAKNGYVAPIWALTADEADAYLDELDALERGTGADLWARTKMKPHLQITALNRLMRHPGILDAVESVLGPDLLVWAVGRFAKPPRDPSFVSWHQDGAYWGLSEPTVVTAWIALTDSVRANGCMRVMPGSHLKEQLPHRDTFAKDNLLSRGQEVAVDVDETKAVDLELQPGEISLHHIMTVHGSEPNRSDRRRVGIAIRYVAAHVRQTTSFRDSATLVRGEDRFGHFIPEPTPERDFDEKALAFYEIAVAEAKQRKAALAAAS